MSTVSLCPHLHSAGLLTVLGQATIIGTLGSASEQCARILVQVVVSNSSVSMIVIAAAIHPNPVIVVADVSLRD